MDVLFILYILYIVDNQAAHGISLFLVDSNLPGFHKGSKLKKLGLKGQVEILCERIVVHVRSLWFSHVIVDLWPGHSRAFF